MPFLNKPLIVLTSTSFLVLFLPDSSPPDDIKHDDCERYDDVENDVCRGFEKPYRFRIVGHAAGSLPCGNGSDQ